MGTLWNTFGTPRHSFGAHWGCFRVHGYNVSRCPTLSDPGTDLASKIIVCAWGVFEANICTYRSTTKITWSINPIFFIQKCLRNKRTLVYIPANDVQLPLPLALGWYIEIGYFWYHCPDDAHKSQNNFCVKQACFLLPRLVGLATKNSQFRFVMQAPHGGTVTSMHVYRGTGTLILIKHNVGQALPERWMCLSVLW